MLASSGGNVEPALRTGSNVIIHYSLYCPCIALAGGRAVIYVFTSTFDF